MTQVTVLGGTGRIGSRIVAVALQRGLTVVAGVRDVARARTQLPADVVPVEVDIFDPASLGAALADSAGVVSSLGFRTSQPTDYRTAAAALVDAVRASSHQPYLLWVGGAGSLRLADHSLLMDEPDFPAFARPESEGQAAALADLREVHDVAWTYLSPARLIRAGGHEGAYRLGGDELVTDAAGVSEISFDDFAAALLDELDARGHVRRRFTVGY